MASKDFSRLLMSSLSSWLSNVLRRICLYKLRALSLFNLCQVELTDEGLSTLLPSSEDLGADTWNALAPKICFVGLECSYRYNSTEDIEGIFPAIFHLYVASFASLFSGEQ